MGPYLEEKVLSTLHLCSVFSVNQENRTVPLHVRLQTLFESLWRSETGHFHEIQNAQKWIEVHYRQHKLSRTKQQKPLLAFCLTKNICSTLLFWQNPLNTPLDSESLSQKNEDKKSVVAVLFFWSFESRESRKTHSQIPQNPPSPETF